MVIAYQILLMNTFVLLGMFAAHIGAGIHPAMNFRDRMILTAIGAGIGAIGGAVVVVIIQLTLEALR